MKEKEEKEKRLKWLEEFMKKEKDEERLVTQARMYRRSLAQGPIKLEHYPLPSLLQKTSG